MLKRNSCEVSQPAAANHQSATATMSRLALPEATQPVPRSPFSSQFDNNEKGGGEQNGTRRNRLAGLGGEGASLRTSPPEPREGLPARRESPERAEPSLVGAWGYPPTPPVRFPGGKRTDVEGEDGRTSVSLRLCCASQPERSESSHPAGESRESGALFGGGFGEPPNPSRSASRQGSGRMSGVERGEQPCAPTKLRIRAGAGSRAESLDKPKDNRKLSPTGLGV